LPYRLFDPSIDYYKVLKLSPTATSDEIRASFLRLSQMYHPDLTNGRTIEKYQKISGAYSVIGHQETKERYDRDHQEYLRSQKMNVQHGS
jgi:curved DNA-binding protein CbpA